MGEAKDCPVCGLVNPPETRRCDCGYDFVDRTGGGPRPPTTPEPRPGSAPLLGCVLGFVGGLLGVVVGVTIGWLVIEPSVRGESGMWVLPVGALGAAGGAIAGALVAAWVASRWWPHTRG